MDDNSLGIQQLHGMIVEAYAEQKEAVKEFRSAARKVARKEHEIEIKKAELYEQGVINGRNAETREAQVQQLLNVDFEEFDVLKELESMAYERKEQAEIEVELCRALLRIEELAATQGWME